MSRRVDIKAILADPKQRRELMVRNIIATQAREGIKTTREQAEAAYDKVQAEQVMEHVRAALDHHAYAQHTYKTGEADPFGISIPARRRLAAGRLAKLDALVAQGVTLNLREGTLDAVRAWLSD